MPKRSFLWVVPILAGLLSGCGIAAKVNARNDMEASKSAYKACLAHQSQDDPSSCEALRQAYEADLSAYRAIPKIAIGAATPPPLSSSGMSAMPALAPPELPPLPEMRPGLIVPSGGGTLMELGGTSPPRLMVPAGSGTFMMLP
jgi:hypothetical protein